MTDFGLDRAGQIRALRRQFGMSDAEARKVVDGAIIATSPVLTPLGGTVTVVQPRLLVFPLEFIIPWSALVSDNQHYAPAERAGRPVIILKEPYRKAKQDVQTLARQAVGDAGPTAQPLALHARVWVPDNRPGHDVCNFAKCVHDALEGIVYTKDEWLHDGRWTRAGVDVDRPRAEIRIAPFLGTG